jgi:hypothetical protein
MSAGFTDESGCCPDFHRAYLLPRSARAVRESATHPYPSSIIIPSRFEASPYPESQRRAPLLIEGGPTDDKR